MGVRARDVRLDLGGVIGGEQRENDGGLTEHFNYCSFKRQISVSLPEIQI